MREGVNWQHGLVTGNGRQGALCWGDQDELRITLSHERLFLPLNPPLDPPHTAPALPEIRRLLDTGRFAEAAETVCAIARDEHPAYAETVWPDPLVGAATVRIRPHRTEGVLPASGSPSTRPWTRSVDFATGVVTIDPMEVFASRTADAIVVRLSGPATVTIGPVDGTPPAPTPDGWCRITCHVHPGPRQKDPQQTGPLQTGPLLILRVRVPGEPDPPAIPDFDVLLAEHVAVHGELLGRVRLDLPDDPGTVRLFDAGRYVIASSTGDLPPTLRGVWSGDWTPPWSSGYTLDGNLPAAVAALLPTGTPELLLPVFDLVDAMRDDFRRNAARLYGARGLLTPVHLTTHGLQNHFGPVWCQTFWTAGAGWLCRLYVDYWRYTGDRDFLRDRAWPMLRETAEFLLDFVRVRDGRARFAPSYSPENAPSNTGSQATADATMDVAIARDVLTNLFTAAGVLGIDDPDAPRWRELLEALPGYRIADGRLAEWLDPGLTDQPGHRHSSHFWPLWYEPDPLLPRDAAVRSVRDKLAWWEGDESGEMGYGLAQVGLAAAALGLAEEAYATVRLMATRYWGTNLVPTHNRGEMFNVDLAGGFPAVVARMLAHSAHGRLDLLPALPAAWPRGHVSGLRVRDAITVMDLRWDPRGGRAVLRAATDVRVSVHGPPGRLFEGVLRPGAPLTLSWESIQTSGMTTYRPPLVPFEVFVADPPELPVRARGEHGLSAVAAAEVVSAEPGGVVLKGDNGLLIQITAAGEGVLRVRLGDDEQARSRSARALPLVTPGRHPLGVRREAGRIQVAAGALTAEITLDPWNVTFSDAEGRVLTEQNGGETDISGRLRTLPFGRSTAGGAVVAYHESFTAPADERWAGLGERFTPLDKRGQRALMWNFDAFGTESDRAYKNVPFYLSSRGYGIVVDSGMPVEFDMASSTHSCVQILVPDDLLDYYVLAGPTPGAVLDRYNRLTTRPLLPPKWAFGAWMSSGFFADTQDAALERARRLRADGIPCDVLHLDCYWQKHGHWSDFAWDTEAFPDPDAMLAELRELGFRVCLWINPYVSHRSPLFAEAAAAGHLLRTTAGEPYVADVWHGSFPACGIIDFTGPAATAWFQGLLRPLLEQGVAVFKTDFAEGVPADARAANGMTGTELHNIYTLLFNDAAQAVTREVAGHGMVWARSSFLGGQRHSAQWGGDTSATYPAMASTLRGGLSHGVSGVPFWSHDAGGFTGTPTDDLYVRWAQFGALSPLVRFHGTTSRLPWHFTPEAARAAVDALRLRARLMPYLYSAAVVSSRTGIPMMRAMLFEAPDDPAAWTADLQYMLGPDLLVAPVVTPESSRDVYFPDGRWIDWWTHEVVEGGRYRRISAPLERIPLYVRHGALIPVAEPADVVGDGPFPGVTVLSFGAGKARTLLCDVGGDTVVTTTVENGELVIRTDGPARILGTEIVRPDRPQGS